jgi:hypothetical protein
MERDAYKTRSFEDAARWDRQQHWALTPDERLAIARLLQQRVYGSDVPDVREAERAKDDLEHLPG